MSRLVTFYVPVGLGDCLNESPLLKLSGSDAGTLKFSYAAETVYGP